MKRTEALDHENNRFQSGDPTTNKQPTQISAEWLNQVQEEIVSAIELAGLTPADSAQLTAAINALANTVFVGNLVHSVSDSSRDKAVSANTIRTLLPRANLTSSLTSSSTSNAATARAARDLKNLIDGLARVARTGSYTDLSNTPVINQVPVAAVSAFATQNVPTGWLECNGAYISRTTYATLYSAIGTTFGSGSSTFRLPDLRGEFIRGWSHGRSVDSGRVFARWQGDALQVHGHIIVTGRNDDYAYHRDGNDAGHIGNGFRDKDSYTNKVTSVVNGRTATETRPRNVALMYCIKY